VSKPKQDEKFKIAVHFISEGDVMPAEINLIESQLGELLQQVIRESDQED